ncbi:MAG: C4-type zinc ribbon domain-containing protein [Acidobacteria bacterium]|nr:C4-type zinc ribbon domain-containing protein [Acidobacteriota bacterium]
MHPDLEHVIRLQKLEDAAEQARRTVASEPARHQELDARLAAAQAELDGERQRLAANQTSRREIEKELAGQQVRLSKFKNQLMEVKTNREYQAVQKEIEVAQHEIQTLEDHLLERMIEFDEVTRQVKNAEKSFAERTIAIEDERRDLAVHLAEAQAATGPLAADREALMAQMSRSVVTIFEKVMKYRGITAVATVEEGRCSVCGVRMRPQAYNDLRRNDMIFQCESCQRILYFTGPPPAPNTNTNTPPDAS